MKSLTLTIVACFFCGILSGAGEQEVSPDILPAATTKGRSTVTKLNGQQKTDNSKQAIPQGFPIPTCDGCFNSYAIEQPQAKTKGEEGKEASLDRLYRGYLLATIIGVIVGVVVLGVLIWQAIINRRVANAAWTSAQAVIDSERPWLLVQKTATRDRIQDPELLRVQQMAIENRFPNCVFYLRNYGKTVAKMTFWEYNLQIGDIPTVPPDKSIYNSKTNQTFIPDVVPQSSSVAQQATFKAIPSDSEFDAVDAGTKFLWLCGVIKYLNASGIEYQTKFCYLWERRMSTPKPFWKIAGPREYTEAT